IMVGAKRLYEPMLKVIMENKAVVLTFAAALIVVCGVVATRLGSEFVPSLNEGDIAIQALRIPGTSLTQSIEMQKSIEKTLVKKF
ncbi:efflux RND transporter permease subunit, partial [Acinetobacter baumannii]